MVVHWGFMMLLWDFHGILWDLPFGRPSQKTNWKDPPCFMAKLTSFLWQFWIKPNHIPAVPGWSLGPGALRGYIPGMKSEHRSLFLH